MEKTALCPAPLRSIRATAEAASSAISPCSRAGSARHAARRTSSIWCRTDAPSSVRGTGGRASSDAREGVSVMADMLIYSVKQGTPLGSTSDTAVAAAEKLRAKRSLRPLQKSEAGTPVRDLPDGVYGFTYSPTFESTPLFAHKSWRSFEFHKQ